MKSRTMKLLAAAATAAVLIVTVAIARTVYTHAAAAGAQPSHASVLRAGPRAMARSPLTGTIACGTLSYADCQQLERMLPM